MSATKLMQCLCSGHTASVSRKEKESTAQNRRKDRAFNDTCGQAGTAKRAKSGLLGGMWELPNLSGKADTARIQKWLEKCGITDCRIQKGSPVCHIFTHIEWHMDSYLIECGKVAPDSDFTWITEQALEKKYALPTAFKKVYTQNRPL